MSPVRPAHAPVPRHTAPGLGIAPDIDDGSGLARYSVMHLGSGQAVFGCVTARCGVHVQQAVDVMAASGLDWNEPVDALRADPRLADLRDDILDELGLCFDPETGHAVGCLSEWLHERRTGGAR